ncbi:MAG: hypothetical protein R2712_20950 [Vicinamibacterales bacterium]
MGTVGSRRAALTIRTDFTMVDREKVLAVLRRRFPGAPDGHVAAAANAIVGLDEEWQEVGSTDLHDLLDRVRSGHEFRLFERLPAK